MAKDLMERGKLAYKNGSYEEAARLFRSAAASAARPQDRISACDLQIGAMVKTRNLEPALDAAKSMIRTNRKDARGYIRAAQVERLANRPLAAARWYQQGLKHISSSDPLHSSLQSGLKKCDAQVIQATITSRPCDPFATLPIEVARIVLEHFDYRQRAAILRVSRGWRSFLTAEPLLTDTVDFSKARKEITVAALGASLRRLTQYPYVAHLTNLSDPAARDLGERLPHWLRRNTLRTFASAHPSLHFPINALPDQPLLTSLDVPLAIGECGMILAKCPSLERFRVKERAPFATTAVSLASSNLHDLRIIKGHPSTYGQIDDLQLPKLRILHLTGFGMPLYCHDWTSLRTLHLRRCGLVRAVTLPPGITDLAFVDVKFLGPARYNAQDRLSLPNLINFQAPLDAWELPLESLALDPMKIETLDVQDQQITEDQASVFAEMPKLKRLTVRNGRRLSGVFVKDLIEKSSNQLEYIGLFNCENVSHSTATWARVRHQFNVEIKNNAGQADARDGRRVFT